MNNAEYKSDSENQQEEELVRKQPLPCQAEPLNKVMNLLGNKIYNLAIAAVILLYFFMTIIGLIVDSTKTNMDTRPYLFLTKLLFMIFELCFLLVILVDIFLTSMNAKRMKDSYGSSTRVEEILNFSIVILLFCGEIFVSNPVLRGFFRARMLLFTTRFI